ncbi:MAG: hypothetical protein KDA66_03890, partial [Planctomycetaceae bacterium]|nr:hypothetical protein [Planctomycetaceae bacterium]
MMDTFDAIESRYGILIPKLYRTMHEAGHFDASAQKHVTFTDHEWMTLSDIATHEFADWQTLTRQWFVPFSISARHDQWGWRRDWTTVDEPAVVFCELGPEGCGYAPNFQGFLYRMLLEELSGSWLLESADDIV